MQQISLEQHDGDLEYIFNALVSIFMLGHYNVPKKYHVFEFSVATELPVSYSFVCIIWSLSSKKCRTIYATHELCFGYLSREHWALPTVRRAARRS